MTASEPTTVEAQANSVLIYNSMRMEQEVV